MYPELSCRSVRADAVRQEPALVGEPARDGERVRAAGGARAAPRVAHASAAPNGNRAARAREPRERRAAAGLLRGCAPANCCLPPVAAHGLVATARALQPLGLLYLYTVHTVLTL